MTVIRLGAFQPQLMETWAAYVITTDKFAHLDFPNSSWCFETLGM